MDGTLYVATMERLGLLAGLAADIDYIELRNHLEHVETMAPLLAPSEWMRGGADNLEGQRMLLDGFEPFWKVARQLKSEAPVEELNE